MMLRLKFLPFTPLLLTPPPPYPYRPPGLDNSRLTPSLLCESNPGTTQRHVHSPGVGPCPAVQGGLSALQGALPGLERRPGTAAQQSGEGHLPLLCSLALFSALFLLAP